MNDIPNEFFIWNLRKKNLSSFLQTMKLARDEYWEGICQLDFRFVLFNSIYSVIVYPIKSFIREGKVEDGRGTGQGDQFFPYIFIERSSERWANTTKQLLSAGGGHQAPRRAAQCLWKEVGESIKDKGKDKRAGMETRPGEGVVKEERLPSTRKPSHRWGCGELWNLSGHRTGRKKINY